MATVQDYRTSFSYGATDGDYYYTPTSSHPKGPNWVGYYHRGNDHPAPVGTALVVGGVTIGYSGNTGIVSGPHCHIQAGTDLGCQHDINPTPLEFQPGTIVNKGTSPSWGNFITVQVGSNFVTYCHLSSFNCNIGQYVGPTQAVATSNISGGTEMITTTDEAVKIYQMLRPNGGASQDEINSTVNHRSFAGFLNDAQNEVNQRNAAWSAKNQQASDLQAQLDQARGTIDQLNQAVTSLTQAKLDDEKIIAQLQANPSNISLTPASTNITQPNIQTVNTTTSDTPAKVKKQTTSLFVRILSAWLARKAKK